MGIPQLDSLDWSMYSNILKQRRNNSLCGPCDSQRNENVTSDEHKAKDFLDE